MFFFTKLVLKTGSYTYQNEKYCKYKIATNIIIQHVWGPQKNSTPFWPVFKLFFRDPSIIVPLGMNIFFALTQPSGGVCAIIINIEDVT